MLAAACIAVLPVTGQAQDSPFSANEVMKGCRAFIAKTNPETESGRFLRGVCVGAVHTLSGTARSLQEAGVEALGICIPKGVPVNQQVRVVAAYIDARPNRLHEDFRALTLEAFKDAWPCKR
jgi:hypothetical protein